MDNIINSKEKIVADIQSLKLFAAESNEGFVKKLYNRIDSRYKVILFFSVMSAVLSHGMALFNKYSFHDDVGSLFTAGATFGSGRWFLHVLSWKIIEIFGKLHSAPLYDGGIAILLISASTMLMVWTFDIRDRVLCGLFAFFMVCFPVVAGWLGFMYFSPYYGTALFLATFGSCVLLKYNNLISFFVAILCMALSLGIYQAYLPFYITILLLGTIVSCLDNEIEIRQIVVRGITYIFAILGSVLTYFALNRYMLNKYHKELTDYKGIDHMGAISLEELPQQIKLCYKMFFNVQSTMLFPKILGKLYIIVLLIAGALCVYLCIDIAKKNIAKALLFLIGILMLPVAVNFHFIMVSLEVGRTTMQCYCYTMVVLWLIIFLDFVQKSKYKFQRMINMISVFALIIFCFAFVRLDNANYLKAEILKTRVISYYTTLVTQIKSVAGYRDGMPITYIKNGYLEDSSVYELEVWDEFYIHPYCTTEYALTYAWSEYIRYWLGFGPEWVDSAYYSNLEEVKKMPCYPNDGSIRIIDDTIVVKLSDSGVGF